MSEPPARPDLQAVGALLLAAGGSSRLGRPKQLVEFRGEALVRRQARLLAGLGPACVIVVTGAAADAVRAVVEDLPITLVHNPRWERGVGESIAAGIAAMPERVRAALLLMADQYRVDAGDLSRLVGAWNTDPGAVAIAGWEDRTGPPTVFPRSQFERLSRLTGDRGARPVLKKFSGRRIVVPMPNAAFDVDLPGDLEQLETG